MFSQIINNTYAQHTFKWAQFENEITHTLLNSSSIAGFLAIFSKLFISSPKFP